MPVDYAKRDWKRCHHRLRFIRRVTETTDSMPCQECRGLGGWTEPVMEFGMGPWEECGWCLGTGRTTRWLRGRWLRWKRELGRQCGGIR